MTNEVDFTNTYFWTMLGNQKKKGYEFISFWATHFYFACDLYW